MSPIGLNWNDTDYYYYKNIYGDILGIMTANGTMVVRYSYDAWGNPVAATGTMANTLGKANPFRYRGYYYDQEIGFYYLQSRYYDPEVGRFINADGYVSTGQGMLGNNMFTYCLNNPICNSDPTGQWCPEENGRREYHDAYIGFIDRAKYDIYVKVKKALPLPRQNGKTVFIGQPRIDTDGSDKSKVDDNNWQAVTSHSLWRKDTVTVLDAYEMPYVARPGKNAAELGDLAVLINWDTGELIKCIVGDTSNGKNGWGEVSIAALWMTGYPNHMTANSAHGITHNYEIILYSGVSFDYDWSWGCRVISRSKVKK